MLSSHIGNTEDMPLRSIRALKEADLVIFEEDRPARRALKSAKVHREYLRFSEHVQKETLEALRNCLAKGGTAAYMSDQGCPVLADPGFPVLAQAWESGATIQVVPGPSSLTAALSACPFRVTDFYYAGFLPRHAQKRLDKINEIAKRQEAIILMDTPYRLKDLLSSLDHSPAAGRKCFLALDISGPDETWMTGSAARLRKKIETVEKKLNFVLILSELQKTPSGGRKARKPDKKA